MSPCLKQGKIGPHYFITIPCGRGLDHNGDFPAAARALARQGDGDAAYPTTPHPAAPQLSDDTGEATPWDKAVPVAAFCQQEDTAVQSFVDDLIYPGAITILAAPRGTGKSMALALAAAADGFFRDQLLHSRRVLLVDRDNSPAIVRDRLRGWGIEDAGSLHILTRDSAPSLRDHRAWRAFPANRYDVVIVDSLGSATEGVSEKEGREAQQVLATLKDLALRGPSILLLDNTNKAGASYRGRGEKADAVDVLYEIRDVTRWTPKQAEAWWEEIPEAGDHAWKDRAKRRQGQTQIRLAFVPSKFRLGVELQPFALELDLSRRPYTLVDVTEKLTTQTQEAERVRGGQKPGAHSPGPARRCAPSSSAPRRCPRCAKKPPWHF
jgi:hypothetical protein